MPEFADDRNIPFSYPVRVFPKTRRPLPRLILSLVSIYVMLGAALWLLGDWLAHHPPRGAPGRLPGEIRLETSDGVALSAVWRPHPRAPATLLFSHGNGENLDHLDPFLRELHREGFSVFAYDYRGYGRSEGRPTEKGVTRDIAAAWRQLTGPLGVPPSRILLHGRSLGSGPTCWLAAREKPGGVILESAFTSGQRTLLPFPIYPFDQFPNLRRLPKIRAPILILHGTADPILPIRHGRQLFAAAHEPKSALWIEGAGHNDLWETAPELYLKTLRDFARKTAGESPSP